jgi:sugar/nucleoside kinase (ribokinase family)
MAGVILPGTLRLHRALRRTDPGRALRPDTARACLLSGPGAIAGIARIEGSSSVQHIKIEDDGERNFVRYDEDVLRDFELDEEDKSIVADSDLRVMPVFQQVRDFFERVIAIDNAGFTAIDFADFGDHRDFSLVESHIEPIDIGFFGLSVDDEELFRKIAGLAAMHDRLMVVTLGSIGSRAFLGGQYFERPAVPVANVIDTSGAGDAFAAGFLSRYCYGAGVGASLDMGGTLAANVIQRIGAN